MIIYTKKELFQAHAPSFNFEHDEDQLLKVALEKGFVTAIEGENDQYLVNEEY